MGVALTSFTVDMEFSGVGGGWTNVLGDVRAGSFDLAWDSGISGNGPTDRVASPQTCVFNLDNTAGNSGSVAGYYSPNHGSKRSGFALGIRMRVTLTYSAVTYYDWIGTIDRIQPSPGKTPRISTITAVDWMDEASRYEVQGVPVALSTAADAVLTALLAAMPKQPNATSFGAGSDAYLYAPAAGPNEKYSALSEFQRIAMSELGFIVLRGGTAAGNAGTLTFIPRSALVQTPYNTSQGTFNDSMLDMGAEQSRESALNVFRCNVPGRRVDPPGTPVVLFSMSQSVSIEGGAAAATYFGPYSDPAQQAARVSGFNMYGSAGQPAMVLGTDYYFTSNPDGTGTDLSANLTFTASPGSDSVRYVVSATVTGFFWAQARGFGMYDYDPVSVEIRDNTSVTAYGENPVDMDLTYQSDPSFGRLAGTYLIAYWKDPTTQVPNVTFLANEDNTSMLAALQRYPGDAITIQETQTGVNKLFRIQSTKKRMVEKFLYCTWSLSPMVDVTDYWILEEGGSSLGTNTTIAL
jgi:hypothetical protein